MVLTPQEHLEMRMSRLENLIDRTRDETKVEEYEAQLEQLEAQYETLTANG